LKLPNLITLTTDFGLQDAYVGQVKGAILCRNPEAVIVDLTHAIDPHDIMAAAVTIRSSYHYFPGRSVHMLVVDPGVGTRRNILAMMAERHIFVAPDNGILTFLMREMKIQALHRVTNMALLPDRISATFHGRDIMAPVAAALAAGMHIAEAGPPVNVRDCVQLDIPATQRDDHGITGRVIHIDRFGNIQTTVTARDLSLYDPADFSGVFIRSRKIGAISSTYSDRGEGELVALIDSSGHLEIAVNRGSAAAELQCRIGDPVTVVMNGTAAR
jgi:hypothetical protein